MEGLYFDPLHGGCLRRVKRVNLKTYKIIGVYGTDEPFTHLTWTATMNGAADDEKHFVVDFLGKPTKKKRYLKATWKGNTIQWGDGNTWTKMIYNPRQL